MAKAETKYGVVLRRGNRYRYKNVLYHRNVPALVSKEVRDHLVEDAGFFVDILLDESGKPLQLKKKTQKAQRRSRGFKVHKRGDPIPLMDTGTDAIPAARANSEGAEEV